MKKKLVLMLTLGVSMVPGVLFADISTNGVGGGGGARFKLGAACQGTTAMYAQKDNGQDLSASISRPMQDGGGVTSALDSGPSKGNYVH